MFINLSNTYSIPSVLGIVLGAETMINKLVCLKGNSLLVELIKQTCVSCEESKKTQKNSVLKQTTIKDMEAVIPEYFTCGHISLLSFFYFK